MESFKHLSYASSLWKLHEVCAVKINLHELLLDNRAESVNEGLSPMSERIALPEAWKMANMPRYHEYGQQQIQEKIKWSAHSQPGRKIMATCISAINRLTRCGKKKEVNDQ